MGKNFLLIAIVSALGFLSCQSHKMDYCGKQLPLVRVSVANALVALEPWTRKEDGRSLASVAVVVSEDPLSLMDRQSWKQWSEDRMKDLRLVSKNIYGDRSMRELHLELNPIATEMMIFYGYAERGRVDRMNESLVKLSSLVASLEAKHCQ